MHIGQRGIGLQQQFPRIDAGEIYLDSEVFQDAVALHVIFANTLVFRLNVLQNGNGIKAGKNQQQEETSKPDDEKTPASAVGLHCLVLVYARAKLGDALGPLPISRHASSTKTNEDFEAGNSVAYPQFFHPPHPVQSGLPTEA
jgi:hypothetical protein